MKIMEHVKFYLFFVRLTHKGRDYEFMGGCAAKADDLPWAHRSPDGWHQHMETTIHYSQPTPWADFYLGGCLAAFYVFTPEVFEEVAGFNTIWSKMAYQTLGRILKFPWNWGNNLTVN